jgi:hypothetical protein
MKKIIALLGIPISIASLSSPAMADEFSNYTCNTGKNLVFVRENNGGQLVYTSFKGYYPWLQEPTKSADLVLTNGRRTLFDDNNQQSLIWKRGNYTYQIIAPTAKNETDFTGNLIVKQNGRVIMKQQCINK